MNNFKNLILAVALFLSACAPSGNQNGTEAKSQDTTNTEVKGTGRPDELTLMQSNLAEKGFVCAAAYVGTILDGKTEKEYIDASEYNNTYHFIAMIDEDRIVRNEGDEVYCIVPAKGYNSIVVNAFVVDESNDYKGAADKELYSANDGKPIIVRGNISEIMPNIIVTLSNGDNTFCFNPSLSMRDGSLNRYNIKDKVQDITIYDPSMVFEED